MPLYEHIFMARQDVTPQQVEAMVEDAGDPSGFDARAWLAHWLTEPLPALGNAKPIELMNTMEGQNLVSRTLAQAASGVVSLTPAMLSMLLEGIDWRMPAWTARPETAV